MNWTLEERADAYLDGSLSREEALAFERELAEKREAALALGAALALRELLRAMPPLRPPEGLEERIAASLPLRIPPKARQGRAPLASVRAALAGASWTVRGPAAALGGTFEGARPAAAGVSQLRWMLGPLAVGGAEARRETARRPLWKRALGLSGA
jgi:anti-sigma factor RsiW